MVDRVTEADFDERVLGSSEPVLVDFYGDSCMPCKRLAPQLSKLEAAHAQAGDLAVVKVNTSFDSGLARRFAVMGTPTLVLFRNGKELDRLVGFQRLDQLETFVKQSVA